ncbi:MAG: hypothetical protein JXA46_17345, partial [Dehalococcoidales bacterium]|nr:hypothetical protein [Dehalococcoidales bacterium]
KGGSLNSGILALYQPELRLPNTGVDNHTKEGAVMWFAYVILCDNDSVLKDIPKRSCLPAGRGCCDGE